VAKVVVWRILENEDDDWRQMGMNEDYGSVSGRDKLGEAGGLFDEARMMVINDQLDLWLT